MKEKLFLLKLETSYIWNMANYESNPSVGNRFELVKLPADEEERSKELWSLRANIAEDDYDPEEQDWEDHVEDATYFVLVEYDPTNPVHIAHPGFEDERPEYRAWLIEEVKRRRKNRIESLHQEISYSLVQEAFHRDKRYKLAEELDKLMNRGMKHVSK